MAATGGPPSTGGSSDRGAADDSGSFYAFQKLVKDVSENGSHGVKTQIIRDFLSTFTGDRYLFFKLLLAKEDKRVFNLREKGLAKVFCNVFRSSLDDFKTDLNNGDVSESARKFFEATGKARKRSTLTLKEVDDFLQGFTSLTKEAEQTKLMQIVVSRCTTDDLKCFVRLLDHDLKAYCGPRYALAALHPDAFEAFKNTADLRKIVDRVLGRTTSGGDLSAMVAAAGGDESGDEAPGRPLKAGAIKTDMTVLKPIKPMLAKACKSIKEAMQRCPTGMFSEIKYDGERIQIHKDGSKFAFYSRSLKPMMAWKVKDVEEYITKSTTANQIILDGEILLVDNNTGAPLPFGTLNVHKKTAFRDASVCVFMFDIMFLNGRTLLTTPIVERRRLLEENLTVIPNRIVLSEKKLIEEEDDLTDMMNRVLKEGLEGLVLKGVDSIYEPAARHWLKIKKDYLDGMCDSADLVVLGGYFGTGSKGGIVSTFLMGLLDKATNQWKTVCKCGSGFDDATLARLQTEVVPLMEKIDGDYDRVPSWLDMHRYHKPDFLVRDPKKSPVWEIFGAEFSDSDHHTANRISIRFPRLLKFRPDKNWQTATSLAELVALRDSSKPGGGKDIAIGKGKKPTAAAAKPGKAPAKTLAGKGKKRARDDDDEEDEDDGGDEDEIVAEPPSKKTAPKPVQLKRVESVVLVDPGVVNFVRGDVTRPLSHCVNANKIIVHFVDDSGSWGNKGLFAAISKLSSMPQDRYQLKGKGTKRPELGDVQFVEVPNSGGDGKTWVATAICRRAVKNGPPPCDGAAFNTCMEKIAEYARSREASVHFSKLRDGEIPNLAALRFMSAVDSCLTVAGVTTLIYTYDPKATHQPVAQVLAAALPPPPSAAARVEIVGGDEPMDLNATIAMSDVEDDHANEERDDDMDSGGEGEKPKGPLHDVFCVFSGVDSPLELASMVLHLGGKVQDNWMVMGDAASTHLICQHPTPVAVHVDKLGGVIVTPEWLRQCYAKNARLPEKNFTLDGMAEVPSAEPRAALARLSSRVSSVLSREPSSAAASKPITRGSSISIDDDAATEELILPHIFAGVTMWVHPDVPKRDSLVKHAALYQGQVATTWPAASITHLVASGSWTDELESMLHVNKKLKVVNADWVWNSIREGRLEREKGYFIERPRK